MGVSVRSTTLILSSLISLNIKTQKQIKMRGIKAGTKINLTMLEQRLTQNLRRAKFSRLTQHLDTESHLLISL